ncbi:NAD(P)H-binding protein [Vibrio parahaemolyticus]|uniref:NAD(P)H-binding protein n=1 Tax=Vibrio sp. EA2 TaxID=3079860 RepID=UPI00294909F7|nr:NAD(P)H-binding protein [Vibrio sp. EA2]MDV6253789.1 NAD(P)H-binding protein [Vibrio sp. EA2]
MKVLITGSTGMIGGLVLDKCLNDPRVSGVVSLVRRQTEINHSKYQELVVDDFFELQPMEAYLKDIDVVFYCLGVYTGQVDRQTFHDITVGYPQALSQKLVAMGEKVRFCLLSGAGADRQEKSKMMFAKDKGEIENILAKAHPEFYALRPGYIYPVTPRNEPNIWYRLYRALYPLISRLGSGMSVKSTSLSDAMFTVGMNGADQQVFENKDILSVSQPG